MSLVADYSSDDSDDEKQESLLKKPEIIQLPSANSLLSGKPGEVFNNVYKKAEEMKLASLEKHCKMVDNEDHIKEKNGKKICWNYRKGRCRFGSNCTFAHDSDLHNNTTLNSRESYTQKQDIPKFALTTLQQHKHEQYKNNSDYIDNSTETIASTAKKRNRPGLGDSITPSKKVMKAFYSTSQQQNKRNF